MEKNIENEELGKTSEGRLEGSVGRQARQGMFGDEEVGRVCLGKWERK